MAVIYAYAPPEVSLSILAIAWLAFVPLDVLRQNRPELNRFLMKGFGPIMREYEETRLAGTTYLFTGVSLVVLIFPRDIVTLTLLILAFADPIASIIGIKYGRDKIFGHKSLQGTFAAFAVCFILSFIYFKTNGFLPDRFVIAAVLAGIVGALAELIPVFNLDDNLTLPLLSATGLAAILLFFGHPVVLGALLNG